MSFYAQYPIEGGGSSGGVTSLNSLTGDLTLVGTGGITVTPSGSTITIDGSGISTLPAPLEAFANFSTNENGPGTFIGNDSENDQTNLLFLLGSTDTTTPGNTSSTLLLMTGDVLDSGSTVSAGNIILAAGYIDDGSGSAGEVSLNGGSVNSGSAAAGGLSFTSGTADSGPAGDITIFGGGSNAANGGNVIVRPGTGTPNGTIQLQDGSQGTAGQVWTSTDTIGSGTWLPTATTGITELTGDVTAGPGSGSQVASLIATSNATLTTLSALTTASALSSVGTITSGTWNGTTIDIPNGGTDATTAAQAFINLSPLTTAGDIIFENATPAPDRLPIGTTGQILTVVGGLPSWQTAAASGANTALSNLTATSVNQNLNPDATANGRFLGTSARQWAVVSSQELDVYNGAGNLSATMNGNISLGVAIATLGGPIALQPTGGSSVVISNAIVRTGAATLGTAAVPWNVAYISQTNDASNLESIDFFNRLLFTSGGTVSVNYDRWRLNNSANQITVDWNDLNLNDAAGNTVVNWNAGSLGLIDNSGNTGLEWGARMLVANDGSTTNLNWASAGVSDFNHSVITNAYGGTGTITAGTSSLSVSDAKVTATSKVMVVIQSNDVTAVLKNVVPGSGTFTINTTVNVTANTSIAYVVFN